MNKKYTLINKFHNTHVAFMAPENPKGAWGAYTDLLYIKDTTDRDDAVYRWASKKLRTIHHKLCPHAYGCACRGMIRDD